MNILFLDAYFFPEKTAYSHLENDLISELINEGNEITVVCPTPSRGIDGETFNKYKNILTEDLFPGKVHVKRFKIFKEKKNVFIRAFRYFLCNIKTYRLAKKVKNVDAIFCNSTPPILGLIAKRLKKRFNKPFIYNLQDLFPDSLVSAKISKKDSLIYKIGNYISNKIYNSADKIIVISNSFKKNLLEKGVENSKIKVINNWVDTDKITPIKKEENSLFNELNIDKTKFNVVYAGNFGNSQGAEIILDVAKKTVLDEKINYVVFGGGSNFETFKESVLKSGLNNIQVFPLMGEEYISRVYSLGDVVLIIGKKGLGLTAIPSKTWSVMATNTPIIASFDLDSELALIIKKAKAGFTVKPEDVNAIVKVINKLKKIKFHSNGNEFVKKYYSKTVCVKKYIKVFSGVSRL